MPVCFFQTTSSCFQEQARLHVTIHYCIKILHSFFAAQMDITRMVAADEHTYIAVFVVFLVTKTT